MFAWDDGVQGDDCLRVNVWTPGINDGKKRPVMVWLHGGGFVAGSGQELRSYDGENPARRGDTVIAHSIPTMIFDTKSKCVVGPDAEEQASIAE
jgi:carboxylesterase type B